MSRADEVTRAIFDIRWEKRDAGLVVLYIDDVYSGVALKSPKNSGWVLPRIDFTVCYRSLAEAKQALLRHHGI